MNPRTAATLFLVLILPPLASAEELFARRIQPLFKEKCLACHGDDSRKIKGGLDMRTRAGLLKGGESEKPSVVPGKPDASPLWLAVTREHVDENWAAMPPKENDKLTKEQLAWVKEWITGGAPWPDANRLAEISKANADKWSAEDGITVKTSGGLSAEWTNRRYKPENLWAYQPVRKPAVPAVSIQSRSAQPAASGAPSPLKTEHWILNTLPANPIDGFINQKLATANARPAPLADRRTLIRRATFDLLGLPPTPEEVSAFVQDKDSDGKAFAKLVDRLLASPHYGEHWGRHWLDVVRYADSSGFANDYARGSTWRYRDYVVRAFNSDKPYDQFIREQLAGDELAEASQLSTLDSQLLVATGFLRMGPWELTGMEVAKVARQRFLDDVTDSVGQVFLAHPLQCARCHDHKFDPVPTRDYYSFQAVFSTTQMADRPAEFLPGENIDGFEEKKNLEQRREFYLAQLKRLDDKSLAAARAWYAERKLDAKVFEQAVEEVTGKTDKRGREAGYSEVRAVLTRRGLPEAQIPPKLIGFTPEDYGHERIARKGLERLKWELERFEPVAFAVYGGRTPEVKAVVNPMRMPANRVAIGELEETCILTGGDPFSPAAKVAPGALSAITHHASRITNSITGRRLDLANWIAAPDNPLTARVMVNRIWQWHFGQALAGNPNNFGATGKKPTHPELLNWLAATFVERGWSVKAMHRLIMSSEAYRRGAVISEEVISNQSAKGAAKSPSQLSTDSLITNYSLFNPRRLTAEELRDAMLRVSGELNPALGGIPVRPEMNLEAALQPRQVMGTFAEAWQPSPKPEQRHRRSLYALKIRGLGDPFMEVFNAPSPDLSCEAREASTVTPQVFALFNSKATYDRALAFASRALRERAAASGQRPAVIERAFQLAFNRAPKPDELKTCLAHWDAMTVRHRTLKFETAAPPRSVTREAVEENTGEKFKFTEPLEAAADFVPDLQPAGASPELRGLAEVCLVLLNANEFAYVY
ncbi:MAG: PSD1 domain-containing protein [Verrucomicrobia bacterium]|nr:PSD1 domain-containing protein [Verrucomicrobiota bacterium]